MIHPSERYKDLMTRYIPIIFVVLAVLPELSFSQQDSPKNANFIIKTDLLSTVFGLCTYYRDYYPSISFEKCFNNHHSIQLLGRYNYLNTKDKNDDNYAMGEYRIYKTVKIIPEYRYFPGKKGNYSGIYTGAYLKYIHMHEIREINGDFPPYHHYVDYIGTTLSFGPVFGYQKYLWKHIVFETYVGLGYAYNLKTRVFDAVNFKESLTDPDRGEFRIGDRTDLRIGINIGYKF